MLRKKYKNLVQDTMNRMKTRCDHFKVHSYKDLKLEDVKRNKYPKINSKSIMIQWASNNKYKILQSSESNLTRYKWSYGSCKKCLSAGPLGYSCFYYKEGMFEEVYYSSDGSVIGKKCYTKPEEETLVKVDSDFIAEYMSMNTYPIKHPMAKGCYTQRTE